MATLKTAGPTNVRLPGGASPAPSKFCLVLIRDGIHQLDGVQMLLFSGDDSSGEEVSVRDSDIRGLEQERPELHMPMSGAGR